MADFREDIPKIEWGASNGNTLIFPGPPDVPRDYSEPDEGSERERITSGAMDAWITATLYVVELEVRHIPLTDSDVFGFTATGWQGSTGWRAFLESAWDAEDFLIYPDKDGATDKTCRLLKPERGNYDHENETGMKRLRMRAYATDGTAFDWY